MSAPEIDDYESSDISDTLINEAARLENEYHDQEVTKPEMALHGSVTEVCDVGSNSKGESCLSSQPVTILEVDTSIKSKVDTPVKQEASIMPEKKKVESSSLKRKATDDSLETIRPQPPDAKPLKKGFKIPKLSKQGSSRFKPMPDLTEQQRQFLADLEKDFANRYTDLDEDYMRASEAPFCPPLVENFFYLPKRKFGGPEESSNYDRSNRNSSPYGHLSRYNQYPSFKHSGDYSNSRNQHERHQQRYQSY